MSIPVQPNLCLLHDFLSEIYECGSRSYGNVGHKVRHKILEHHIVLYILDIKFK
jgi:hypothetical protein